MKQHNRFHLTAFQRYLLVVAVVVAYTSFTIHSYGIAQGLSVTALTWAFFVFATPIADGGFVIAFPIRMITGFRMLYTQFVVWTVGALLVASYLILSPETFGTTTLLELFYAILTTPWPLGIIIVLSAIGTFVSIRFDDEVVDVAGSKNRKVSLAQNRTKLYVNLAILVTTILVYMVLLQITDIDINII